MDHKGAAAVSVAALQLKQNVNMSHYCHYCSMVTAKCDYMLMLRKKSKHIVTFKSSIEFASIQVLEINEYNYDMETHT